METAKMSDVMNFGTNNIVTIIITSVDIKW